MADRRSDPGIPDHGVGHKFSPRLAISALLSARSVSSTRTGTGDLCCDYAITALAVSWEYGFASLPCVGDWLSIRRIIFCRRFIIAQISDLSQSTLFRPEVDAEAVLGGEREYAAELKCRTARRRNSHAGHYRQQPTAVGVEAVNQQELRSCASIVAITDNRRSCSKQLIR